MVLAAHVADTNDSVRIRSYSIPLATGGGGEEGVTSGPRGPTMPRQRAVRGDCDKFTLWVRVFGPEIFAGSAVAVPATNHTDCYWRFDFQVRATVTALIGLLTTWLV